jgi:pyruvate/2-oxoglutarate dehydrogenase complex dihydrolipoamide acyltransferase (E2) component
MIPNAPPVETHGMNIDDLFDQAKQWLDGKPIETQGQADEVGKLLEMIRDARKAADTQRDTEKRPHDEASKAVQKVWKPLLDKCDLAASTARSALTPWRVKLEEEQKALAEAAQREADEAAAKLRAAHTTTAPDDLEGQIVRADLEQQAKDAAKAAKRASNAKVPTSGVTLRSYYSAVITDPLAFGKWAWVYRQADYLELLQTLATREATGLKIIPGLTISSEKRV